jgi:hypothetical protein
MIETFNKSFNLEKTKRIFEMDRKLLLGDRVRKTTITKNHMDKSKLDNMEMGKDKQIKNERHFSLDFSNTNNKELLRKNSINNLMNFDELLDNIKEEEVNHDYLIDLTEDELRFRFETEENKEMKEFCK